MVYYHAAAHGALALLLMYAKNDREDLSPDQRDALRKLIVAEYG